MSNVGSRFTSLRRAALASTIFVALAAATAAADERTYTFDFQQISLSEALRTYAKVTGQQIIFTEDLVAGRTAPTLKGAYTAQGALVQLLAHTGLTIERSPSGAIMVRRVAAAAASPQATTQAPASAPTSANAQSDAESQADDKQSAPVEKVTVTGSRIKGARSPSPVVTITQEEMRRSGWNNVGEAMRAQPQNFAGGQNPGVLQVSGLGNSDNSNVTGGSSVNLRGLGPNATLTLLNGARLPYDGGRQATDISVIPTSAIERVEILLDGASAIYGSDAVGGVTNVILKRDYEGAELSVRLGAATDGGYEQQQYTALAGTNWGSGGFLITGDASKNTEIRAAHRDYVLPSMGRGTLHPALNQNSVLFSGHQLLGDVAEFALDAFYTSRDQDWTRDVTATGGLRFEFDTDSEIWGFSPSLDFTLPHDWSLRVQGFVGQNRAYDASSRFTAAGAPEARDRFLYDNLASSASVQAEGPLFPLPGGEARASVGGGWRKSTFEAFELVANRFLRGGEDSSYHGYGEVNLPLIGEDQEFPLVSRLTLNGAVRYENYDSFGGVTTPKVGAIWTVTPGFDLKASWGRSFKVPTLSQQFSATSIGLLGPANFANPPGSAGKAILFLSGGNPTLGPERAEIVTSGFIATPDFLPGLSLEFNWYDIDYTDRVSSPFSPLSQAFSNPNFADFVIVNPSNAQIAAAFALAGLPVALPGSATAGSFGSSTPTSTNISAYNAGGAYGIADSRSTNVASQKLGGIDLIVRYRADAFDGDLTLSGNGSWITENTRQVTIGAASQSQEGLAFFPAAFKGRAGFSWSRDGFTLSSNVNHTSGVADTFITPNVQGKSMTTLDLVVDYQVDMKIVGEVGFNLAITNLFDEAPPLLTGQPFSVVWLENFDSSNYSPIGRVVNLRLTKRF